MDRLPYVYKIKTSTEIVEAFFEWASDYLQNIAIKPSMEKGMANKRKTHIFESRNVNANENVARIRQNIASGLEIYPSCGK